MSDLTSSNCGCRNCNSGNNCMGGNNYMLLLLLTFCGGFGSNCGGCSSCNNDCDSSGCNNCCEMLIWIMLLSCMCGNGNGSCC